MNKNEKHAIQLCRDDIVEDLDAEYIVQILFSEQLICKELLEEIQELNETRRAKCERLLNNILRQNCKCTFDGFIKALQYKNVYDFLASTLEKKYSEIIAESDVNDSDAEFIPHRDNCRYEFGNSVSETNCDHNDNIQIQCTSVEDENSQSERIETPIPLFENIRRINPYTSQRRKLAALSLQLKRLSHDGQSDALQKYIKTINTSYERHKLNLGKAIGDKMCLADMHFTALEADLSERRVKFDVSDRSSMFNEMKDVIPFTTDPRISSMTFCAR